jgi:hypothetical protein
MIGRRRVLQMLGVSSVGAPLAARMESQKIAAQLGQVSGAGLGGAPTPGVGQMEQGSSISLANKKLALNIPGIREELQSLFYEVNRNVYAIDYDLATKKSFSLAAKITYQRQRNVAIHMKEQAGIVSWGRVDYFWSNIAKRFFLGGKTL